MTNLLFLASDKYSDGQADKIRPEDDGQHALPKSEMEKADRKKPSREPRKSRQAMIFDFYLLHILIISKKVFQAKVTDFFCQFALAGFIC
jgi:hypothetical protein